MNLRRVPSCLRSLEVWSWVVSVASLASFLLATHGCAWGWLASAALGVVLVVYQTKMRTFSVAALSAAYVLLDVLAYCAG